MVASTTSPLRFQTPTGLPLVAAFDGGRQTRDGRLPWLAEADAALELCAALAGCIPDRRRGLVRHSRETLVRQRVFPIACGYVDQHDATTLRADPLLKLVCGRLPGSGADLASQSTLSRLENAVDRPPATRLAAVLVELYVRERGQPGPPRRRRLDVDGTDDPAHGQQEGVRYHGYDDQHMYHPLLVFDGDTGHLITAVLRPGNVHASRCAVRVLRRLVRRLRQVGPVAHATSVRLHRMPTPVARPSGRSCLRLPDRRPIRQRYRLVMSAPHEQRDAARAARRGGWRSAWSSKRNWLAQKWWSRRRSTARAFPRSVIPFSAWPRSTSVA